ncbi:hypothetical protein DUI87_00003 [Hirundo rustica rustica]|uniref:Gap junction protein n=1 Tax=Hirundo rustica rustica TaxID=333673 RepID=A0A3M0LD56_HIRRU|nr:hypothetical protein DUI87_00003 [Hirundo rustica rustica]
MGEWTILERLLEAAVQQHSTMIGRILLTVVVISGIPRILLTVVVISDIPRILLTVVVIFRILIVAIVGETVYEDEQSMFLCNALQPGCNQACYDLAFPISHMRYWVFQILLVCTPSLCFITYSVHQAAKRGGHRGQRGQRGQRGHRRCAFLRPLLRPRRRRGDTEGDTEGDIRGDTRGDIEGDTRGDAERSGGGAKGRRHEGISRFYVIQVVFRNALEIGFLGGQYFLYGFKVPAIFECRRYPCLKEVECYVSRPTEKSVFLVFMFAVSGVCVLLNLAELNHLGWRKVSPQIPGVCPQIPRGGHRDNGDNGDRDNGDDGKDPVQRVDLRVAGFGGKSGKFGIEIGARVGLRVTGFGVKLGKFGLNWDEIGAGQSPESRCSREGIWDRDGIGIRRGAGQEFSPRAEPKPLGFHPKSTGTGAKTAGISPKIAGISPKIKGNWNQNRWDFTQNRWELEPKSLGFHPKSLGFHPKSTGFHPKSLGFHPKSLGFHPKSKGTGTKIAGISPKIDGKWNQNRWDFTQNRWELEPQFLGIPSLNSWNFHPWIIGISIPGLLEFPSLDYWNSHP